MNLNGDLEAVQEVVRSALASLEANRDRILLTLVALDLMLMAFFVVMNSTATFDGKRSAEVARGSSKTVRPSATSLNAMW